ncbi:hypothetical protein F2P81_009199 [Scophthalmus maximus]|uniref:Uncharacterized protein n=1 Tax=Scophthalmus maximus TaxID=52904 RepID=A0A6A4T0Y0_SCOMX|nr:hypothetical protein F2P81_009199 [Scophthalmus maximus]
MNEKAQWQNRTGSFSNPRLQCPPRHPSTVCSRWAAGVAGRERKRERGEQGLHQGCSLDRANKSRPVTCSMAPFEEWGKFGQCEEKGRHSLFSLPKQLRDRDRQERGKMKNVPQAANANEQDTSMKGWKDSNALAVFDEVTFSNSAFAILQLSYKAAVFHLN